MGKLIPELNKSKFKYEYEQEEEYINDDPDDAFLDFKFKNKLVTITTDWVEGFDVDEFVSLLFLMATGQVVGPIFHELVGTREPEEVEYIKEALTTKLEEHKKKIQQDEEDEEPLVSPVNAFIHMMTVNATGNGE